MSTTLVALGVLAVGLILTLVAILIAHIDQTHREDQ